MNASKKYICIVVMLSFVFSISVFSNAEENWEYSDELKLCMDLGIIKENDFSNGGFVSAKDFAYITARLSGIDIESMDINKRHKYLLASGFLKEYKDTDFSGVNYITYGLAANILVCVAGYEQYALNKGPYPQSYQAVSHEIGITSGLTKKLSDRLTIDDVAKMVKNTFSIPYMKYKTVGQDKTTFETNKDITVLSEKHNIYKGKGTVNANSLSGLYFVEGRVGKNHIKIDSEIFKTKLGLESYLGMKVTYYYKEDSETDKEILAVIPDKSTETLIISSEKLMTDASGFGFNEIIYEGENGKAIKASISEEAAWIYNGIAYPDMSVDMLKPEIGEIRLISNNGGSEYDIISVWDFESAVVEDYNYLTGSLITRGGVRYKIDSSDFKAINVFDTDGKEIYLIDIKYGSIISMAKSLDGSYLKIIVSKNKITGTISEVEKTNDRTWIVVDGKKFEVAKGFMESGEAAADSVKTGTIANFFVDFFGRVVDIESKGLEGMNVGYLVETNLEKNGIDRRVQMKILTSKGAMEIFDCAPKVSVDSQNPVSGEDIITALKSSKNVFERTLIRYVLNSKSEITEIDLPYTTEPKNKESANTLKVLFDSGSTRFYHKITQNLFGGQAPTDGSTIVFKVPARESTEFNDDEFSVSTISSVPGEASYDITAYCIGNDTIMTSYLCVYAEDTGGVPLAKERDKHFAVIEKVTSIISGDEITQKVTCIWRGTRKEYITYDSNVFPAGSVNEGDVVYLLIHNDKVRAFLKVYDCENDEYLLANPTQTYYLNEYRTAYGAALRKENGFLEFIQSRDPLSGTANKEICKASAFSIAVIDMTKDKNRVSIGSVNDIDTYDVSKDLCSKIVMFSSYGDPRYMAVYKYQ